jgi:hypothetical protein
VLTTLQVSRRRGRTRPSRSDILLKASRITAQEPLAANIWRNHGVAAMILKLTTNDKASIWVNLSRILQMTLIDAQDGYPKTQIVMANGAVICVFETPDDIAQWTKTR